MLWNPFNGISMLHTGLAHHVLCRTRGYTEVARTDEALSLAFWHALALTAAAIHGD